MDYLGRFSLISALFLWLQHLMAIATAWFVPLDSISCIEAILSVRRLQTRANSNAQSTLFALGVISLSQSFMQTSPFAYLIPPISTLPFHPISYFSELFSAYRLHVDYNTQVVEEIRQNNVLDAQKRRLYRRAHGMENLDMEEEQGVDVRGLVPWDDGLTNKERERGGRISVSLSDRFSGVLAGAVGRERPGTAPEPTVAASFEGEKSLPAEGDSVPPEPRPKALSADAREGSPDKEYAESKQAVEQGNPPKKRGRVKRWFGIWE